MFVLQSPGFQYKCHRSNENMVWLYYYYTLIVSVYTRIQNNIFRNSNIISQRYFKLRITFYTLCNLYTFKHNFFTVKFVTNIFFSLQLHCGLGVGHSLKAKMNLKTGNNFFIIFYYQQQYSYTENQQLFKTGGA